MNATLIKAVVAFVPVLALVAYSVASVVRDRAVPSFLLVGGSVCLLVVVFTHVAEALHLFPAMGWGDPHSVGHYVDLSSAAGGIALTTGAVAFRLLRHER